MRFRLIALLHFFLILVFLGACSVEEKLEIDNGEVVTHKKDNEEPLVQDEKERHMEHPEHPLTVHFINVGQGDATLLQTKDAVVLIDAGRHDQDDVVPYLKEQGVESIDLLIGTHPHSDHIGQFVQVLENFHVKEVWMSGGEATSATFENTIDAIIHSGSDYYEPRVGEKFQIGPFDIEVLHPSTLSGNLNNDSVSTRIHFGEIAFLFTGDAESQAEKEMLSNNQNVSAHFYKVGHHGSSTSSTSAFLQAVQAEVAIISAGEDNSYGHPHWEIIEALSTLNIPIYGTYIHGHIIVETDGVNYEVRVEKNSHVNLSSDKIATEDVDKTNERDTYCIDLNTATLTELQEIVHIGEERAIVIESLRPFSKVNELKKINGIGDGRLRDILDQGLVCEP